MAEFRKGRIEFDDNSSLAASKKIPDPPGYDVSIREVETSSAVARRNEGSVGLKQQALMSMATAPFKNVLGLVFMMYMSGNSVNLFPIMITMSALYQPLTAILQSGNVFKRDESSEDAKKLDYLTPRLLFCLIHAGVLLFALHKLNNMGLLPTHLSDYISFLKVPEPQEIALPLL